ncbi:AMP-dependent synthetase/ligase [Thermodesulfobacteriota bacterium]
MEKAVENKRSGMTFPGLLEERAKRTPKKIAMREKAFGVWREYTWEKYFEHVKKAAAGLVELGLEAGDKVAIQAENSPQWIFSDLATQMVRGITVGIYPTSLAPEIKFLMEDSGAQFFIAGDQEQLDKILSIKDDLPLLKKIILIETKGVHRYRDPIIMTFEDVEKLGESRIAKTPELPDELLKQQRSEDVAMFIYTSGTTGKPKAAMIKHINGIYAADDLVAANPVTDKDVLVSYLPLCHSAERLYSVLLAIKVGYVINFAETTDTVVEALYEIAPTFLFFMPRILESVAASIAIGIKDADPVKRFFYTTFIRAGRKRAELLLAKRGIPLWLSIAYRLGDLLVFRKIKDRWGINRVKFGYCGGAAVSTELLAFFHALGTQIREVYGGTELIGITFCHQGDDIKLGTAGKPLRSVEYKFNDKGEILQRRKTDSFEGYYNRPEEKNKTILEGGWINLGDKGFTDEDGNLTIVGRTKELFFTAKGEAISPAEIENKLKFSPYVNEAIILGEGRNYVTALIQIEYDMVADWAQSRRLAYTTFKSLAENPEVVKLIGGEVHKINDDLDPPKRISKFKLLPKELDQDDEELTATRKIKRNIITERFQHFIREMYP